MENKVKKLAYRIVSQIRPYSHRLELAGSIRRKAKNPRDIDIVLIPKDKEKIREILGKKGKFVLGGEKKAAFRIHGTNVELYYTNKDSWGATLLAYSSKKGAGIGLRRVAKKLGYKLNQYGLFKDGKKIAGKTEREIYKALNRRYKKPENR